MFVTETYPVNASIHYCGADDGIDRELLINGERNLEHRAPVPFFHPENFVKLQRVIIIVAELRLCSYLVYSLFLSVRECVLADDIETCSRIKLDPHWR